MNVATKTARDTVRLTSTKNNDSSATSLIFLGALWFSLFFGVAVLFALVIDTAYEGSGRFDSALVNNYISRINPAQSGFRAGILGTIWLMITTAVLAVPIGIAAALYMEEFADNTKWYNRLIELNLQNLAAVPAIVYGLLAVAIMSVVTDLRGIVLAGALALALLILPVIIITTREAVRSVPTEIRHGSLALGATVWQTTWRQTLPSAIPGIATGTILGLSRAIGEAAPLVIVGLALSVRQDPSGLTDQISALPFQIYRLASESQEEYRTAASAAIILLLVMVLGLNAVAILIRNKFQRSW